MTYQRRQPSPWANIAILTEIAVKAGVSIEQLEMSPPLISSKNFQEYRVIYFEGYQLNTRWWVETGEEGWIFAVHGASAEIAAKISKKLL